MPGIGSATSNQMNSKQPEPPVKPGSKNPLVYLPPTAVPTSAAAAALVPSRTFSDVTHVLPGKAFRTQSVTTFFGGSSASVAATQELEDPPTPKLHPINLDGYETSGVTEQPAHQSAAGAVDSDARTQSLEQYSSLPRLTAASASAPAAASQSQSSQDSLFGSQVDESNPLLAKRSPSTAAHEQEQMRALIAQETDPQRRDFLKQMMGGNK
jgi:hypothetical protein